VNIPIKVRLVARGALEGRGGGEKRWGGEGGRGGVVRKRKVANRGFVG
jgi:hypothetical protein